LVGYKGLHIYRVYLPHKNRVVWSSSVTFDESGTFLTTPISEEEGGDDDICWVPLEELPTKDTTPEVSRSLQEEVSQSLQKEASQSLQEEDEAARASQEEDKASQALQEEEATRSLKEQDEADEVSRASQSGGDSQSGGASGDHDIAPQPARPPLTDNELSSEPVIDIIRRFQETDEVSRASLSGGDSGDHDIAPQLNQPPLTEGEQAGLNQQELPDLGGHLH